MKRSFLKELGIESEAIDKIMAENGKDIERFKSTIEDYASEIKELKANNSDNTKAIEKAVKEKEKEFTEKLKAKDTEYQEALDKVKEFDNVSKELEELKKANNDREYTQSIDTFFKDNKIDFTSNLAKEAIINKFKEKEFKLKDGKFSKDATDFMKQMQEENKDAFKIVQIEEKGNKDATKGSQLGAGTYNYEPKGDQNNQSNMSALEAQVNSILGIQK